MKNATFPLMLLILMIMGTACNQNSNAKDEGTKGDSTMAQLDTIKITPQLPISSNRAEFEQTNKPYFASTMGLESTYPLHACADFQNRWVKIALPTENENYSFNIYVGEDSTTVVFDIEVATYDPNNWDNTAYLTLNFPGNDTVEDVLIRVYENQDIMVSSNIERDDLFTPEDLEYNNACVIIKNDRMDTLYQYENFFSYANSMMIQELGEDGDQFKFELSYLDYENVNFEGINYTTDGDYLLFEVQEDTPEDLGEMKWRTIVFTVPIGVYNGCEKFKGKRKKDQQKKVKKKYQGSHKIENENSND